MSQRWIWTLALSAGLVGATGCSMFNKDKEKEEGNEVKMKFTEVPPAVQKTLTEQAMGQKIDTVDKEMDKGKVVYETDVKEGGKNWEIRVAEDGKLISKKIEEDEKEEKGEKHEKGEKGDKD
jgi:hypothetical protein